MSQHQSDETEIIRGIGVTLVRHIAVALIGLIWTVIILRAFPPHQAGLLLVVASIPTLVPPLIDLGLPTAIAYTASRSAYPPLTITSFALTIVSRISVAFLVVISVLVLVSQRLLDVTLNPALVMGALAVPCALFVSCASGYLRGIRRFRALAGLTVIPLLLLLLLSGAALLLFRPEAWHIAALLVVAYAVPALWTAARYNDTRERHSASLRRLIFRYSLPLYVSEGAASVRTRGNLAVVAILLGPAPAALFGAGAAIAAQLSIVAQAAHVVVLPFASRDTDVNKESADLTTLASRLAFLATAAGALVLLAMGPGPIAFLLGESYEGSWSVLAAYTPGVILLSISRVLTSDLSGRGRTRLLMVMNIVAALVGVGAVGTLAITMGVVGAALGVSFTAFVGTAWRVGAFKKITGRRIIDLVVLKRGDVVLIRRQLRS